MSGVGGLEIKESKLEIFRIDWASDLDGSAKVRDIASMIVMATTVWYLWLARNT